jgi:hypothetical protein
MLWTLLDVATQLQLESTAAFAHTGVRGIFDDVFHRRACEGPSVDSDSIQSIPFEYSAIESVAREPRQYLPSEGHAKSRGSDPKCAMKRQTAACFRRRLSLTPIIKANYSDPLFHNRI